MTSLAIGTTYVLTVAADPVVVGDGEHPPSQGDGRRDDATSQVRKAVLRAIEDGDVATARRIARAGADRRAEEVLAVPRVSARPASGVDDRALDFDWLRDHAKEYAGQWVALRGGKLLAATTTLAQLQERLRDSGDSTPLITRVRA